MTRASLSAIMNLENAIKNTQAVLAELRKSKNVGIRTYCDACEVSLDFIKECIDQKDITLVIETDEIPFFINYSRITSELLSFLATKRTLVVKTFGTKDGIEQEVVELIGLIDLAINSVVYAINTNK